MKCPNCGNETQEDAVFCDQCGQRLSALPATEAAPVAPQPVEAPPALPPAPAPIQQSGDPAGASCPSCGVQNTPGEMFCSECGTPLASPEPEPEAVAAPAIMPATDPGGAPICPDCGAAIQPGEEFCFACGAAVAGVAADTSAPAPVPQPAPAPEPAQEAEAPDPASAPAQDPPTPVETLPAEAAPQAGGECPSCGGKVSPDDTFCGFCGASLVTTAPAAASAAAAEAAATVPGPAPVAPAAPATQPSAPSARLVVAESNIEIPLPDADEIIVGREDPVSGIFPEIDLTPHGAEDGGVSRRHFRLRRTASTYTVEDLNSTNFTLVNLQRLEAGKPARLSDGDEIRAGRVRLVFKVGA